MTRRRLQARREPTRARRRTDCAPEALAEDLGLLDLTRVDLAADDGAEGDLCAQLLRDRERERRLAGAGPARQEERASREFLELDQRRDESAGLETERGTADEQRADS